MILDDIGSSKLHNETKLLQQLREIVSRSINI